MGILVLRDLDPHLVTRKYERVLDQLRRGDFRSAEVRKLRGSGLYRARLDERDRLLFSIGEHGGRSYLLVLEVVRNHDYAKARFLNGGSFTEADLEPASPAEAAAERLRYVNPASPAFHVLDKPLSFDEAQTEVFDAPLPLIVIGSAGSGKTALTLEKMKTLPGHGLYLTRSPFLVDNARSLYFANGYANDGQEVDFLSIGELLETIEVPPGRPARYADFAAWYARMRGLFKLKEPHKLWEEINGVLTGAPADGPWMSDDEYLSLGVRQSIFLVEERPAVLAVFRRWLAHMREQGLYDVNVAAWERRPRAEAAWDFLVVDEVQDVTTAELRLALACLREERAFLLCGDSNQIVHPNLFSWARVKSLLHEEARGGQGPLDRIHVLTANYRNTAAVTAVANRLLLVKQRRFGSIDRESTFLVESVGGGEGRFELLADGPEVRAEIEAKTRRSVHTAVVVLRDEDKASAREAFSTPLVFSVQEAKGLEYDNVVLFNLVSVAAAEYRECAAGVVAGDGEGGLVYARARDKQDKSLDAYKFYVNALYVAMTRAVRSLIVVERDVAHPLWTLLAVRPAEERVELRGEESSREEWQREARRLELQGKVEQAEQIRREILDTSPVPWTVIDAASFDAVRERALGPPPRDKASQQLLFEYALTCDAPDLLPALVEAGFRHARRPDSGRAFIEETHHADYRLKPPRDLPLRIARHGVDFRNPLNETPLMVAAKIGRADLVRALLADGADPDLLDNAGRTPLRAALGSALQSSAGRREAFRETWSLLADRPIKTRVGSRMSKLDPRQMEWFLLNACLVLYRPLAGAVLAGAGHPVFRAPMLEDALRVLPDSVLPPYRKSRSYLSSLLAKNEAGSASPYNRRLFRRVARGAYVLNPALDVDVKGAWTPVYDVMALPLLLRSVEAGRGASFARWLAAVGAEAAEPVPARVDAEGEGPAPDARIVGPSQPVPADGAPRPTDDGARHREAIG